MGSFDHLQWRNGGGRATTKGLGVGSASLKSIEGGD